MLGDIIADSRATSPGIRKPREDQGHGFSHETRDDVSSRGYAIGAASPKTRFPTGIKSLFLAAPIRGLNTKKNEAAMGVAASGASFNVAASQSGGSQVPQRKSSSQRLVHREQTAERIAEVSEIEAERKENVRRARSARAYYRRLAAAGVDTSKFRPWADLVRFLL